MSTITGDKSGNRPLFTDEANQESRDFNKTAKSIFDVDGNCVIKCGLESVQCLYDLTRDAFGKEKSKDVPKEVVDDILAGLTMDKIIKYIAETTKGKAKYMQYDIVKLSGYLHGIYGGAKTVTTTLGRLMFNVYVLSVIKCKYRNIPITKGVWSSILKEEGDRIMNEREEDGIVKYKQMLTKNEEITFKLSPIIASTSDYRFFALSATEKAERNKILKKYKADIDDGNIDAMEQFENEVVDYMKISRKDDPFQNITNSGVKVKFNEQPKMAFVSSGTMPTDIGEYQSTPNSLIQGFEKKDISMFGKSGIVSGYYRAVAPADGGAMAKVMIAGVQTTYIDKFDTDCGTKDTQPIFVDKKKMTEFIGRYMKVSGKDVLITYDNVEGLVGTTINLRSPMMCESKDLCNKCVGNKVYDVLGREEKIPFGLFLTTLGDQVVQKSLKKVHKNKAQFVRINPNDMLEPIANANKNRNIANSKEVSLISQIDMFDDILDNIEVVDEIEEIQESVNEIFNDEFAVRELASRGYLKINDNFKVREVCDIEKFGIQDSVNVVVEIETQATEDKELKLPVDKFVDTEPSDSVILKGAAWYMLDRFTDYFDKVQETTERNIELDKLDVPFDYVNNWYKKGAISFLYEGCKQSLGSEDSLEDLIANSPIHFEEQAAKGFYIMKIPLLALDTDKITLANMPNSINDMKGQEYENVMKQLEYFIEGLDSNADTLMTGTTLDVRMDDQNLITVIAEYPLPIIVESKKDSAIREGKKVKPDPKKLKMNAILKDIAEKKKASIKALLTEGSGIKGAIKADYGQKFASVKADLETQFSEMKATEREKFNVILQKLFEKMEVGQKKRVVKARTSVYKSLDKVMAKVDIKTQKKIDKLKDKIQAQIDKVKDKFTD